MTPHRAEAYRVTPLCVIHMVSLVDQSHPIRGAAPLSPLVWVHAAEPAGAAEADSLADVGVRTGAAVPRQQMRMLSGPLRTECEMGAATL